MSLTRRSALATAAAAATVPLIRPARSQAPTIKIGVLNDQSGVFADNGGTGSVAAAKLAILASIFGIR